MTPHQVSPARSFSICAARCLSGHRGALALIVVGAFAWVPATAAASPRKTFDVPGGTAESSLKIFSEQSGREVLFATQVVKAVQTRPVKGAMTPREAIERMLADTDLIVFQDEKADVFSVRRKTAAEKRGQSSAQAAADDRSRDSQKKNEVKTPSTEEPMKRNKFLTALAATLALLTAPAEAQTASTGSTSAGTSAENKDETIELSPFIVNAESDVGYVANETLAGSRLNTRLIDTPAAIDVMTIEFLQDLGATTLEEALEYSVNADNDIGVGGINDNADFEFAANRVNIRGLQASRTRNFFPIVYSADPYSIDRIEEQRGPNSILFGIGSPAGIINVNTKRAHIGNRSRSASTMVNSAGGYRGTFDVAVPVNDAFALRFNAVYSDMDDDIAHFAYKQSLGTHLAATWKVSDKVRFRGEFEWTEADDVRTKTRPIRDRVSNWLTAPNPRLTISDRSNPGVNLGEHGIATIGGRRMTYVDNNETVVNYGGLFTSAGNGFIVFEENHPELWDRSVNVGGPGQARDNDSMLFGGAVEFQIGPDTFLELAVTYNETETFANLLNGQGLRGDPNQFLADGVTPNVGAGKLYIEGAWARWRKYSELKSYRATLSHEVDLGRFGNYRFAAMSEVDYESYSNVQQREKWVDANGQGLYHRDPRNAQNNTWRRYYITQEGNWADYHTSSPMTTGLIDGIQADTGEAIYSAWRNQSPGQMRNDTFGTMLTAMQARYFGNRLVLGVGYRYDILKQRQPANRDENNNFILNEFGERVLDLDTWSETYFSGNTKTLGAVYHINKHLRLMANQSDNFGVPNSSRRTYPNDGPPDNTEGEGYDIGIGFQLWGNKVSGRISRFATDSKNIYNAGFNLTNINETLLDAVVANQAVTGVSQEQATAMRIFGTGGTVDQSVEGYEFSMTANVTRNWRLIARYSFTEGAQTNSFPDQREYLEGDPAGRLGNFGGLTFFENPAWADLAVSPGETGSATIGQFIQDLKDDLAERFAIDGVTLPRNRPHKASLFTRYSFSEGALAGAYIGGGVKYQSAAELGLGQGPSGEPFALEGNSFWTSDLLLGYSFREFWGLKHMSVQLNVANLFDFSDYLITARHVTTQRITKVTYLRPRSAKLSVRFSF